MVSSSVSESPARRPAMIGTGKPKPRRLRLWIAVIGAVVISVVLFLMVRFLGYVSGEEFSPTDFQQRSFSFYEIPLIHVQITPISRSGTTTDTARYVRQNSLIRTRPGPAPSWHLVWLSRQAIRSTPADAKLLVDQLRLEASGKAYWEQWSRDHPQRARVFWPAIQRLAVRELYLLMPPLFELAQRQQSATELAGTIDAYLRREYAELVRDLREAGRDELADQLLQEAVEDFPQDETLAGLVRSAAEESPAARSN